MSVHVYTAIVGEYPIERQDVECFTGDKTERLFVRDVMEAKRYKVLSHLYLPQHEITFWTDGNIALRSDPEEFAKTYLGDADLALFRNPGSQTVWDEFRNLQIKGSKEKSRFHSRWLLSQLTAQEAAYRAEGLPADARCFIGGIILRRNTPAVNRLMEAWWAQICRWQWRDQVSLPYVLWKHGDEVNLRRSAFHREDWRTLTDFRFFPLHPCEANRAAWDSAVCAGVAT